MKDFSFNLVWGISGCSQAEYSPSLLQGFKEIQKTLDLQITVVATENSLNFFDHKKIKSMVGKNRFFTKYGQKNAEFTVPHIQLAEWADVLLIYPTSAHMLARCAHGLNDVLLANLVLATQAPVYLGPTMNEHMFESKAVQKNLRMAKSLGYKIIPSEKTNVFVHADQKHVRKDFISHAMVLKTLLELIKKKL